MKLDLDVVENIEGKWFDYDDDVAFKLKYVSPEAGKRITTISLAECMAVALEAEEMTSESIAEVEMSVGLNATIETIHEVLNNSRILNIHENNIIPIL